MQICGCHVKLTPGGTKFQFFAMLDSSLLPCVVWNEGIWADNYSGCLGDDAGTLLNWIAPTHPDPCI